MHNLFVHAHACMHACVSMFVHLCVYVHVLYVCRCVNEFHFKNEYCIVCPNVHKLCVYVHAYIYICARVCISEIQYSTVQLYCLCVEKFAFWLVIYIKTFNKINSKTSTTQWKNNLLKYKENT